MKNLAIIILALFSLGLNAQKKQVTLEDIWKKGTFRGDFVRGFSSTESGEAYRVIEEGELIERSFKTGSKVKSYDFYKDLSYDGDKLNISSYRFSADGKKMLLFTAGQQIYRRSSAYKVYLYDIENKKTTLVNESNILHASFSPTSDRIAFVKDNNMHLYSISDNETVQITTDGNKNIINGNCDWVYEEEFGFTKAYQWSPDGKYLAFYRFDQTAVPEFTMMYFRKLYPTKYEFKYPKAGDPNSTLKIGLYNLRKEQTEYLEYEEEYIPRIKWTQYDKQLIIFTLNRHQNQLRFYKVNPKNLRDEKVYEENNKYYVEVSDEITFLKSENAFVHTSERNGYNHIYYYNMRTKRPRQLTKGNWDVVKLYGVDESSEGQVYEDQRKIYYSSAEKSPMERNLYSIKITGDEKKLITPNKGWNTISWSKQFKYFLENYSNVNTPPVYTLKDNTGKTIRVLKDNARLKNKLTNYDISPQELIKVRLDKGLMLNGWMIKPSNFKVGEQYPLIMFQYSGPGSQQVTNRYPGGNYWWYQMLAQKGYVIACVDGRGTGFRGEEFKKMTYQQLGKYETDDQIAAAQYFGNLDFIDNNRIGIWGWSYGGYMSSICIAKGADVFKSAIAVAPVTNWRYYDNIYTERYMRTPQENPDGYDDNSPINMVDKIKGNYLLIHGSGDDNVHYQNTMEMINAMIKADVEFDSEIYPNRNHGIYGGNTRYHLYKKMTDFWLKKL
jgi:dipeptidyl-peptidase-4